MVHPVSLGGWTEWHLSHSGCSTHLAKAKPWNHQLSSQYPLNHLERKMLWLGLLHVDICSEIKTTDVIYENRMSSQVVILFLSFGGIFSSPNTELIEWTIKPDLSIKCMILGLSAKTRKQGPSRMSRMLSTQSWDYTKGRAAMLGEAGGGALPTHTHSYLLPNFLSQELRTNQSKVATGPHRAHSLIHSLSLAPCLPQGFLSLVTEDWGWDWEGSRVLATPALYTQANITIPEQLTLVISALLYLYFCLHLLIFIFTRISQFLNYIAPRRPYPLLADKKQSLCPDNFFLFFFSY